MEQASRAHVWGDMLGAVCSVAPKAFWSRRHVLQFQHWITVTGRRGRMSTGRMTFWFTSATARLDRWWAVCPSCLEAAILGLDSPQGGGGSSVVDDGVYTMGAGFRPARSGCSQGHGFLEAFGNACWGSVFQDWSRRA